MGHQRSDGEFGLVHQALPGVLTADMLGWEFVACIDGRTALGEDPSRSK